MGIQHHWRSDLSRYFFAGFAGHTLADSSAIDCTLDPAHAELMAAIWAILWAMLLPVSVQVTVLADSTNATDAAEGRISGDPLVAILCATSASARQRRNLRLEHVKAHMDAPWNELADSVAKGCRTTSASPLPPYARNTIKDHTGIEWD